MLFSSLIFLVFLPIVFSAYWLIPAKHRNLFLLIASYYFYFSYNPWFSLLLIGTSGLDFYLAKAILNTQDQTKRKTLLVLSIISNIGVLFAFKYFVFFYNSRIFSFIFLIIDRLISIDSLLLFDFTMLYSILL